MQFVDDQAASRVILDNGTVITKCDQCKEMWRERNERGIEGEPDCVNCRVDLLPINNYAAEIYQKVRSQVKLYFNGQSMRELDIEHSAIWSAIDHFPHRIKNSWEVFERILHTYHYFKQERDSNI